MTRPPLTLSADRAERVQIGTALKTLRERRRLTQGQVGAALGMTAQAWQPYEKGERGLTEEKVDAALAAIGASRDDLASELDEQLGRRMAAPRQPEGLPTLNVYGRARAGALGVEMYDIGEPLRSIDLRTLFGPSTGALEIAGDSMVPWAEPGELVIYDRDRYPKRGAGCLIETKSGEYYVKRYEKSDGSTLFVSELFPEERMIPIPLKDVKGVYAIRLRGD